jgi:hypothetical protein
MELIKASTDKDWEIAAVADWKQKYEYRIQNQ